MEIDETMSQDVAFTNTEQEDVFKFDEVKETTPDSQPKVEDKETSSTEDSSTEEDEQKVPYTRFEKKVKENGELSSKVQFLEEQLEDLRNSRKESETKEITPDAAWIELYGDSDIAKKAFQLQLDRENQIAERAIEQALERIEQRQEEETQALSQNEATIDSNLENLQEVIGRKLSVKEEEAVLSIVDEFSPTGNDGKYVTLFPFDKAYEIYELRTSVKGRSKQEARDSIADLTSGKSEGEAETSGAPFKKGWDSWREAL